MEAVRLQTQSVGKPQLQVYIKTFGCQMNEYDSLKLLKLLEDNYRRAASMQDADLVIINTCSVREKPELKVYSLLGELQQIKQEKPDLIVGVGGCVAQQEGERLLSRPPVDFVFGTHNLSVVPALIELCQQGKRGQVAVDYRDEWEELPLGLADENPVSVFVTISRGCDRHCSYCVVPKTRGRAVSRPVVEIEREVKLAVQRGAREVLLLGQTVNSYGQDLNPPVSFEQLLERISQIDNLWRIRFTSPHPAEVSLSFIDYFVENKKLCRHIHLPLQSGSDKVLQAMNRRYTQADYLRITSALRERLPEVSITTDLIVGFPGETEEDFQQTLRVMDQVKFDSSFSFMYSARPETEALALQGDLMPEEKLQRLQRLQQQQQQISAGRLNEWVGKQVEVLLDGPSRSEYKYLKGRSSQNITVNLIEEHTELAAGMLVSAQICEASKFSLRARPGVILAS